MEGESTRRHFLRGGTLATAGLIAAGAQGAQDAEPHQGHHMHGQGGEAPTEPSTPGGPVGSPTDRGKLVPGLRPIGEPPVLVQTPDLPEKLAWTMKDGAKEFHLYCRHTRREFLPDMSFDVWGFNGGMPGPTIEVTEGDRVRIWAHNDLPESTGIHWHGLEIPVAQDGVPGLSRRSRDSRILLNQKDRQQRVQDFSGIRITAN